MKHASLFTGFGAPDIAAEAMGWDNVFACEIADFPVKVLKNKFPNLTIHNDIKATDFRQYYGLVDVLTGGFPCQPFSHAGARAGTEDPRHLWPEMFRAVKEIRPRWVLGENVSGIISWSDGLVFETVCTDLESEGYEVQPFILPACSVDAPHRRDRVFFIAYSDSARSRPEYELRTERNLSEKRADSSGITSDTESQQNNGRRQSGLLTELTGADAERVAPDTPLGPRYDFSPESLTRSDRSGTTGVCNRALTTAPLSLRLWGQGNGAGVTGEFNQFSQTSYWENFPTQPPVCSGDDGLPDRLERYLRSCGTGILTEKEVYEIVQATISKVRKESIKGYGNAIVPQVVLQVFRAIEDWENFKEILG